MVLRSRTIFSYASQEKCSHSPCLVGSVWSSSVLGCTFNLYTSQSYSWLLKRYWRSPRITSNPVSSKTSLAAVCLLDSSYSSTLPQTDCQRCCMFLLFNRYDILISC